MTEVAEGVLTRGVEDALSRTLSPVRELQSGLKARREQLSAEIAEIDSELRRVDRVLKAVEAPVGQPKKNKGPQERKFYVSDEVKERVHEAIVAAGHEVTIKETADQLDLNVTTVDAAFNVLRQDERIRVSGKRKNTRLYMPMGVN